VTHLPLIAENVEAAVPAYTRRRAHVTALEWGDAQAAAALGQYDLVLGADLMYIPEASGLLVSTLKMLVKPGGEVLLTYGRNRRAEEGVLAAARAARFEITALGADQLDPEFRCEDVTVLSLRPSPPTALDRRGPPSPSALLAPGGARRGGVARGGGPRSGAVAMGPLKARAAGRGALSLSKSLTAPGRGPGRKRAREAARGERE
jgi:hypothetical protein